MDLSVHTWTKWFCPPGSCLCLVQVSSHPGDHLRCRPNQVTSQFNLPEKLLIAEKINHRLLRMCKPSQLPVASLLTTPGFDAMITSSSFKFLPHWLLVLSALPLALLAPSLPLPLPVVNSSSLEAHLDHSLYEKNGPHSLPLLSVFLADQLPSSEFAGFLHTCLTIILIILSHSCLMLPQLAPRDL